MPHGKLKIYSNIVNFYGTIELPLCQFAQEDSQYGILL